MRSLAALTASRSTAPRRAAGAIVLAATVLTAQAAGADPVASARPGARAKPVTGAKPVTRATKPVTRAATPAAVAKPVATSVVRASDHAELVARRWPSVPRGRHLSMSDQITERLTEIGNRLGQHLDLLSQDMFQLKVDARKRRAHIRLGGGGDADSLFTFRVDGDIQFHDLNARVDAHVDLGFNGHMLRLELPAFQVQAAEYRGEYGVQLEIPLFERRF